MDKEKIRITERPESVSWEEISDVLKKAHAENVRRGILMSYPQLPSEKLKEKVESFGGRVYVALDGDKVVGTGAVAIMDKNYLWCGKGLYAYCFLDAVLPEYAGRGIYARIASAQEEFAVSNGVDRMLLDTNENNNRMIRISRKNGYKTVYFRVLEGHNSVVLVKWLKGCPYSSLKCAWMFFRIKRNKKKRCQES